MNTRKQLIDIIDKYAGDEYLISDWIEISKENESDLISRINSLIEYYYNVNN